MTLLESLVVSSGRSVAVSNAAVSSVCTFLVGAVDASFLVMMNCNVTTATTHSFSMEVAYTDETNSARVVTFPVVTLTGGAFATNGLIANGGGTAPYESVILPIRCKAATSITLRTNSGGTYTTVTYNIEGFIMKLAGW